MCGGTTDYKAGVRFCSVTKAKPKVGQWWESAYVHGRTGGRRPPEVSCCSCWWTGHARQKPTWPRPRLATPEPPRHRPLHPLLAGCLGAVRVRLSLGRSIAPGGRGCPPAPAAAAAPAFSSAFLAGATPLLLSRLQHAAAASLQL